MRKIFLIPLLSMLLLTQCENAGQILEPVLRNPQPSNPSNKTIPSAKEPTNSQNESPLGMMPEEKKEDEIVRTQQYPQFVINSFNETGQYMDITGQPTPPTLEDIHANTAISTFRLVADRYQNAIISPFLFSCDRNGATTLKRISQLTNGKLDIRHGQHLALDVDKAVYFSANWDQQQLPQSTNIMFRDSEIDAIKIQGKCYYQENDEMQLIYLPLQHDEFSVYLFVPKTSLSQLLANMQFPQMNEAVLRLKKRKCDIEIPALRVYFNLAINKNQRAISLLQLDQYGCEFASVHTRWSKGINGMESFGTTSKSAKFEDEDLDLAKVKAPYLKNKSEEAIQAVVDKPFFVVLRHLKTGEFLATAAINDVRQISEWQGTTQHLTPQEIIEKTPTLERFGWGYTRRIRPQDLLPENDPTPLGNQ